MYIPATPTPSNDSDDITLTAYDTAPANGAIPSSAKQLAVATDVAQTIVAGQTTTITFTLLGTPSSIAFASPRIVVPGDQGGTANADAASVRDASGQTIVGAFSSPVTLAVNDSGNHTSLAVGSGPSGPSAVLSSSNDASALTIAYDGAAAAGYSATLASSTVSGQAALATIVASAAKYFYPGRPPAIQFAQTGQTTTVTVTEAGFTGAMTQTNTCSSSNISVGTAQSIGSSSQTFAVSSAAQQPTAPCTITFSDGTNAYVPINTSVGPATVVTVPSPGATTTPSIVLSPATLAFLSLSDPAATVAVSEAGYSGSFVVDAASTCYAVGDKNGPYTTISPSSGATSFAITPRRTGTCAYTIRDAGGIAATLAVTVTSTTLGGQ